MKPIHLFLVLGMTLTLGVGMPNAVLAKAPETALIVFTSSRLDGNKRDISVMEKDGSDETNLTAHPADDFHPAWSPTGEQILFVSDREGIRDLYLMDADGGNVRRVFKEKTHREDPGWSPDGRWIVYTRPAAATLNIATPEGDAVESIAPIDFRNVTPAWSPDGTEIVFDSWRTGRIQLLHFPTRDVDVLLPQLRFVMLHAAWAPDGDQLAFAGVKRPVHPMGPREVLSQLAIYVVNRDGTEVRHLVDGKGAAAMKPVWSPRGDALLYQQKVKNPFNFEKVQIFKRVLGRDAPQQLTDIGRNHDADWFDPAYALPVSPPVSLLTTTWGKLKTPFLSR